MKGWKSMKNVQYNQEYILGWQRNMESLKKEIIKKIIKPLISDKHKIKINAVEMRFLRKIEGQTERARIREAHL